MPGYPWVPAVYLVANAALLVAVFAEQPRVAGCTVLSILSGLPVHALMVPIAKASGGLKARPGNPFKAAIAGCRQCASAT